MTTFTGTISTISSGETTTGLTKLNDFAGALKAASEAWSTYTPTLTNFTLGNGTLVARYLQVGKWLLYRLDVVGGTTSSASGAVTVPLPGGLTAHSSGLQSVTCRHYNGTNVVMGGSYVVASGTAINLATTAGNITTFGNGHEVTLSADLELA